MLPEDVYALLLSVRWHLPPLSRCLLAIIVGSSQTLLGIVSSELSSRENSTSEPGRSRWHLYSIRREHQRGQKMCDLSRTLARVYQEWQTLQPEGKRSLTINARRWRGLGQ